MWFTYSNGIKGSNSIICSGTKIVEDIDIEFVPKEHLRHKEGDLTQSYDKSPYTNRNVKGAK